MTHESIVIKDERSPGELLAAQSRFRQMMIYENHKVDIAGQLAAGQLATAAVLARMALERGLVTYLLARGETGLTEHNVWTIFRRVCGRRSRLFREALALAMRNPDTPDDVARYVADCMSFVEQRCAVTPAGYGSPESLAEYARNVRGVGQLAALIKAAPAAGAAAAATQRRHASRREASRHEGSRGDDDSL